MPNHLVIPLMTKDRLKHYHFKKIDIYSLECTYVTILHCFVKYFLFWSHQHQRKDASVISVGPQSRRRYSSVYVHFFASI